MGKNNCIRLILTFTSLCLISCLRGDGMGKETHISPGASSTSTKRSGAWTQEMEIEEESPYDETEALLRHLHAPIDPEEPIVQMPHDHFQKKPRWNQGYERMPLVRISLSHPQQVVTGGQPIEREVFDDGIFLSRRELMKRRLNSLRVSKLFPDLHPKPPRARDVLFPEDVHPIHKKEPRLLSVESSAASNTTQHATSTLASDTTQLTSIPAADTTQNTTSDTTQNTTSTGAPDTTQNASSTGASDTTQSTTSTSASDTTQITTSTPRLDTTKNTTPNRDPETTPSTTSAPKAETTTLPESVPKERNDGGFFKWPPSWWPFSYFSSPREPPQVDSSTTTATTSTTSVSTDVKASDLTPAPRVVGSHGQHALGFIPVSNPSLPLKDARPNRIWFLRDPTSNDMPMPYFRHFQQRHVPTGDKERAKQNEGVAMKFRFENGNLSSQQTTPMEDNCTKTLPDGSRVLQNGVTVPPGFKCAFAKKK